MDRYVRYFYRYRYPKYRITNCYVINFHYMLFIIMQLFIYIRKFIHIYIHFIYILYNNYYTYYFNNYVGY